jgi:hypothetical protein
MRPIPASTGRPVAGHVAALSPPPGLATFGADNTVKPVVLVGDRDWLVPELSNAQPQSPPLLDLSVVIGRQRPGRARSRAEPQGDARAAALSAERRVL